MDKLITTNSREIVKHVAATSIPIIGERRLRHFDVHSKKWTTTYLNEQNMPTPDNKPEEKKTYTDAELAMPGWQLKRILSSLGIKEVSGCKCNQYIKDMNNHGIEWCEKNVDKIVGWLHESAKQRKWPFVATGAKFLVKLAIKRAKEKAKENPAIETRDGKIVDKEQ